MTGLLARARQLRTSLGLSPDGRDEFAFDPESGISREEQAEIRAEIEKVGRDRIGVGPEAFAVKAAKRGVLFPVVVNIAAVAALVIGLGVFYFIFQRGETQLAREDSGTITAEGKLIKELQKEAEARLQAKNQQINQIQGQLAEIDKQRLDLQSNMDARVRDRENELRAAMAADLDAEKARLQKQGLSDQDIQKKLADLESQKNAAFTKQLDAFRAQSEAERRKSEATLKDLQAQFNANLARVNTERQQVLSDSRQREADLQAQLSQKTKELQSQQAQTQAQLQELTSQRQQEDLVAQQLVGLYSAAQADISEKNYPKALGSLKSIARYVNSPEVVVLPGLAKRREVDLFIVDSLSTLVQGEIDKGKVDTTSLVNAANQIAEVRARVSDADGALGAGRLADAEKLYSQALAVIPEIARSYAYFTAHARESDAERQDALRAGLSRAESAFDAGRYAEMLAAYKDALVFLPESSTRLDRTLSNIGTAGAVLAGQKTQAAQSRAAASVLGQGSALLKQRQFGEALAQFLTVLAAYPASTQAPQAVKGISDAAAGMNGTADVRLASREKDLGDQVSSLQKSLAGRSEEIVAIKKSIMGLLGMSGDPAAADGGILMNALNRKLGDLSATQASSGDLGARLQNAQDNARSLQVKIDQLSAENDRLKAAQPAGAQARAGVSPEDGKRLSDLDALIAGYRDYTNQEDAIIRAQGETKGRMKTIGLRDSLLGSLDGLFRGMLDRIHHYDDRFIKDGIAQGKEEGRQDALTQAIDVVMELNRQSEPDQRKSYFDAKIKAADKDPQMKEFLKTLLGLASAMK
jgi:hypothetical protein